MSELTDIMRNGEFIRAYTGIESSGSQKGIIYIEDASDRLFWERVVNTVCPNRYDIKPFSRNGAEGKRALEKEYEHLNKDRLVAVDSDYDYLCPSRNAYATALNSNPFVLHTFFYSRESFINTPEAIDSLAGCIHLHERLESQLIQAIQSYSSAIYEALCLFSWLHNRDHQQFREDVFNNSIRLPAGARLLDAELRVNEEALRELNRSADEYLLQHRPYIDDQDSYMQYQETLNQRGINPNNAILFTNGHYLLDSVFRPLYEMFINASRKKDKEWVEANCQQSEIRSRKNQVENHYRDNCGVKQLIHHCEAYREAPFWQRIIQKLSEIENSA
ncbi:DUF4435 domain-containing protein [Enterobacter cloacae]|uniref:DUF4435 domain-containing protein n=1 Tax=Enterobacter cloacae TaxID=550 RepID=UPI003D6ED8C4|nr:DUF4435 domain-containing protein [Enterobacter cloacae subsp. dissolvens]HCR2162650.1 DUF4435 domain-containing protein [Enterobacter cloacae subsp. dissolvens]